MVEPFDEARRQTMIGRRRPLARAAMVGGAGYMAGKRMQQGSEREAEQEARLQQLEAQQTQQQYAAPPPPPAPAAAPPPAPAAAGGDLVGQLTELKGLLDAGALSQEEFDAAKQKLLAG
jgi:hypothetical protein